MARDGEASFVLVDGYNAIRRIPSLGNAETRAGLAAGRRALLATIVASGVLRSSRVRVVFDARERVGHPPEPSPHPRLTVRYSTPPEDADAAILALLRGAKASPATRAGAVTVVTADGELSWKARQLGARVVAPERWEGLRGPRPVRRKRGARAEGSDKPASSPSDVDYWLGVFGEKEKE